MPERPWTRLARTVALTALVTACSTTTDIDAHPSLEGRVVDANGRGHVGASVHVDGPFDFGTVTDADGGFTLERRPPSHDDYPVRITLRDPQSDAPPTTLWAAYDERSGVQLVADVRLSISGTVGPMPADQEIVTLRIVGGGTARQEDTDLHGRFTVRWLAPDTTYAVSVWRNPGGWTDLGTARTGDAQVSIRLR